MVRGVKTPWNAEENGHRNPMIDITRVTASNVLLLVENDIVIVEDASLI